MQIREATHDDAAAVVSLLREVRPANLWSVEAFVHGHRTRPERARFASWVAEEEGAVVGWASAMLHANTESDDSGGVHVSVRPRARRAGIGRTLYGAAMAHLLEIGARRVSTVAVDDAGYGFLERRGFAHTHTERFSQLDPREADLVDLPALEEQLAAQGYVLAPFADCSPEGIHAVDAEASADVPEDDPMTFMPFEEWRAQHWEHPMLAKDGSFAVVHEGHPVTIAMLRVDREGRRAGNDITGTLRAHRGRGLARLAKLGQLAWLASNGYESVVTSNDSTNAPMLAVNTRLGYVPFREERSYVRELEP